jgi:hypothetical protein
MAAKKKPLETFALAERQSTPTSRVVGWPGPRSRTPPPARREHGGEIVTDETVRRGRAGRLPRLKKCI